MRFLADEDLPRSMGDLPRRYVRRYEHEAVDVRDIGLRGAKEDLVTQMPGKLAIVEAGRVRIRTG